MSRTKQIMFTCPQCNTETPFKIWTSVNTVLNPEMKTLILDKSAFLFKCPQCGYEIHVDYGFLYHQMEDKIMIQYANSDDSAEDAYKMLTDNSDGPAKYLHDDGYLLRLVRTQNELIEKIEIFDAHLDDRIVEIFKLLVLDTYMNETNEAVDVETLYYQDKGKNLIQVNADGKFIGISEMMPETYKDLCETYSKNLPSMREDGPCINRQWALALLNEEN